MRPAGLAVAAALGALASGCGGDDDAPPDSIAVRDFEFVPPDFEVKAGEAVTWDNEGEQIHNVKGEAFFSRAIEPGSKYEFTFDRRGTYEYLCTLHPQMKGKVVVG
ncbi:MAG: plastocyanin/azurin family copper-binding protein [Thermoleophilaceae bacterium]